MCSSCDRERSCGHTHLRRRHENLRGTPSCVVGHILPSLVVFLKTLHLQVLPANATRSATGASGVRAHSPLVDAHVSLSTVCARGTKRPTSHSCCHDAWLLPLAFWTVLSLSHFSRCLLHSVVRVNAGHAETNMRRMLLVLSGMLHSMFLHVRWFSFIFCVETIVALVKHLSSSAQFLHTLKMSKLDQAGTTPWKQPLDI